MQHPLHTANSLCNTLCMTVSTIGFSGPRIPQWDMQDRMFKSLRTAGLSIADAAEYFDVHRNTVSGWIHGRIKPDTRTIKLWAIYTGVPLEWLQHGIVPDDSPDGGGGATAHQPTGLYPIAPIAA